MDMNLPLITKAKLVLTEECQLRCKYCYEKHSSKRMSLDTAIKIVDYIFCNANKINRLPEITFFGGEPLLVYEELMKPCIEYIRGTLKSRCPIGFTTNGLLLDEDKLKYLKSMNVNFMLSIDGCEAAHNANRVYKNGRGSFRNIDAKIPLILKYYPNTVARMTLTQNNLPYLYESVKYIADKGFIAMHIIPNIHIPTDNGWCSDDYISMREQLTSISEYIIDEFESGEVPLVFKTLADMFPRIVLANYNEKVNHHRKATCCLPEKRCGIGVLHNAIFDITGNIFSCQHGSLEATGDNPLYLGNIDSGLLHEKRVQLLEMNRSPLISQTLNCEECPLNSICTGGCAPNNYAVTGSFTILPEVYCMWTQCLYNAAADIIRHFDIKEDNTLFKDYFYGVVKRGVICVC